MTTNIDAVKMTRAIRDRHYELLKDKTPEERIAFYRQKAQELHQKLNREPHTYQSRNVAPQS